MSSGQQDTDRRAGREVDNPYAAPDAALPDLPGDADMADGVSVHDRHPLLSKVVGDKFPLYARRWHLDDGGGGARPWHWPALLFEFYWLMFRKMYLVAFVYLLITFAAGAAIALVPALNEIGLFVLLGLRLLLCISGNELYRWHCTRLVARAQASHRGQPEAIDAELTRRGGTSRVALVLGLVFVGAVRFLGAA